MNALLLTLALVAGQPPEPTDAELAESARRSFDLGVETRDDARIARPHFIAASEAFRRLWDRAERTPELAQAWARAEFLAGNLPQAIAAAHRGLLLAPHHAGLQRDLETYRDAVPVPPSLKSEERLRPSRIAGVRARVSEWDLFRLTAIALLLLGVGVARRFTVGSSWALPLALGSAVGLLICAGLAGQRALEQSEDRAAPVWVLRNEEPLRKGNGESHAYRVETPLPRGAEVREIARRGGWVQVQLAGGVVGWLPEQALLPVR